jgi:hypothetical protein
MCLAGLLWFREPAAGGYLPSVGAFVAGAAGPGYLVGGPLYQLLQVRWPIHHVGLAAPTGTGQSPTARSLASAYWS